MNYVMNESTGEIKFYVGSPTVPDATTNFVMTLQNNLITFHKPTSRFFWFCLVISWFLKCIFYEKYSKNYQHYLLRKICLNKMK